LGEDRSRQPMIGAAVRDPLRVTSLQSNDALEE
jgi:hypothetical protein